MNSVTVNAKGDTKLLNKLYQFYRFYREEGDLKTAEKIVELLMKVTNDERIVAFCGHFSAGKSSMINKIIGKEILASSPIPTSANLVKLKVSDRSTIKVFFQDGVIREYPATIRYEQLKEFFKDGKKIRSIEIDVPSKSLPNGAVIMDTPGIDSTDDAHRLATESALHLADVLFYVMDYNHVLAEENFLFTKEMVERGKEIYLIVNMIDKHQEQELSFTDYKKSIEHAFHEWNIFPKHIFYTSLKEENHIHNDFQDVLKEIQEQFTNTQSCLDGSVNLLMEEHLRKKRDEQEEIREQLENVLSSLSFEERNKLEEKLTLLTKQIQEKEEQLNHFSINVNKDLQAVLKNAYLMPSETRELAKEYLETEQKDFKVGLFFAKKKTEEVKVKKYEAFYKAVQENVNTQILWHLKELFGKYMKENGMEQMSLAVKVQHLSIPLPKDVIRSAVKRGALVTGESVLNFTKDVTDNIKKHVTHFIQPILGEFEQELCRDVKKERIELEGKKERLRTLVTAKQQLEQLDVEYQMAKDRLYEIHTCSNSDLNEEIMKNIQALTQVNPIVEMIDEKMLANNVERKEKKEPEQHLGEYVDEDPAIEFHAEQQQMIHKLTKTAQLLRDVPTMEKVSKQLMERAKRLKEKQFTVALFGAFSAGKSSFANALIGEKLLPVSPNPTTATINRILPANEAHPAKTGVVTLKRTEQLLSDINEALEIFGMQAANLAEAYETVNKLMKKENERKEFQTQISFLSAFAKGYPIYKDELGKQLSVGENEFKQFVAEEEKSCFVEAIDFHIDSTITNHGITFVDTPGADSINARHTDVAFEYIKNADAIIFVTYYNHAFSKADREFLIQLGRVKDQFALDKMFFIVNAIDLANSEEELNDVVIYVQDQLLSYGIRNPKIYPVSSMNALKERRSGKNYDSKFLQFEQGFYRFISYDLGKIALTTSKNEWNHAVERLRHLVETANTNQQQKEEKRKILFEKRLESEKLIKGYTTSLLEDQIKQELNELVYYIRQRANYRFNDFFIEAFNPATIKGSGGEVKKALERACKELLQSIGFDLTQELRATSLRLENFLSMKLNQTFEHMTKRLCELDDNLSYSLFEMTRIDTPTFTNELKDIPIQEFSKPLSMFKSTRTFFEKNEKKLMAEAIQTIVEKHIIKYIQKMEANILTLFSKILSEQFKRLLDQLLLETSEQYEGFVTILEDKIDLNHLKNRLNKVELLFVNNNSEQKFD